MSDESEKRRKPEETKRPPAEWRAELHTPSYVFAGAARLGAHQWIQGVTVTRSEYEETIARFLGVKIGSHRRPA